MRRRAGDAVPLTAMLGPRPDFHRASIRRALRERGRPLLFDTVQTILTSIYVHRRTLSDTTE
jgi:hypothetical protein